MRQEVPASGARIPGAGVTLQVDHLRCDDECSEDDALGGGEEGRGRGAAFRQGGLGRLLGGGGPARTPGFQVSRLHLFCSGCPNKVLHTGALTQQKLISSQFLRLEVQGQRVRRVGIC